ncbi:MAG: septum formation initiator family protein [Sphingomonas sp.]
MARRALVKHSSFRLLLRRAAAPAALLIVGVFFGGYAILGPNGALAYGDIKRQLGQRKNEMASLDRRRAELRNRVELLDPKKADPDMVDELVRKDLNVAHPDEVIVPLRK